MRRDNYNTYILLCNDLQNGMCVRVLKVPARLATA